MGARSSCCVPPFRVFSFTHVTNTLKKQAAGVTDAAAAAVSTIGGRAALRSKRLGRSLADHAKAGYTGKSVADSKVKRAVEGATVPDVEVLKRKAHDSGKQLAQKMQGQKVSKRDLVQLRRLSRGDFGKLLASGGNKVPVVREALKTPLGKEVGSAVIPSLNKAKRHSPEAVKALEDAYKGNKFTSNVMGNITRPAGKRLAAGTTEAGRRSAASAGGIGAAATSPLVAGPAARRLLSSVSEKAQKSQVKYNRKGGASALDKIKNASGRIVSPAQDAVSSTADRMRKTLKERIAAADAALKQKATAAGAKGEQSIREAYKTSKKLARRTVGRNIASVGYSPSTIARANRAVGDQMVADAGVAGRTYRAAKQQAARTGASIRNVAGQTAAATRNAASGVASAARAGYATVAPLAAEVAALPANTARAVVGTGVLAGRALKSRFTRGPKKAVSTQKQP